jgi:hypothetical protein
MAETPDKPAGSESHPPGVNPARQGPSQGKEEAPQRPPTPKEREPRPEASPGEPGVTSPKRGKV